MLNSTITFSPSFAFSGFFRTIIRMLILLTCFVPFTSCGYRFAGGEGLPQGIERLYIQLLENKTTEPGIDLVITSELKNEFIHKYRGVLVEKEAAEAILSGAVVGIQTQTVSRRGALRALARSVDMRIDLTLKKTDGQRIWFAKGITRVDIYSVVPGDKETTERNKRNALKDIAARIAEESFYRLTDVF